MTQHTPTRPLFDKSIGIVIILALVGATAAMWHHNTQPTPVVQTAPTEELLKPEQMVMKPSASRTIWNLPKADAGEYVVSTSDPTPSREIQKPVKPRKPEVDKAPGEPAEEYKPLVKPPGSTPSTNTDKEVQRLLELEIARLHKQVESLQKELEKKRAAETARPTAKGQLHMPSVKPPVQAAQAKRYLTILRDTVQYEQSISGRMHGFSFKVRNDSDKIADWGEVIIQCFNQQGEVFENCTAFFENLNPGQTMVLHSSQVEQFPHEYKIDAGKTDPQIFEFRIR